MNYWLLKSEPDVWSIEQQKDAGSEGEGWALFTGLEKIIIQEVGMIGECKKLSSCK